jgi:hypothetical protein
LPGTPAARNAGPEMPARPPVKTTANSIASRTGQRLGSRDTDGEAKAFKGRPPRQRTLQTAPSREDRLRRRHRPPLRPDLPEQLRKCAGSTTGNGGGSTSRPAGGSMDRRIIVCFPTAAFPGANPLTARTSPFD